jgi:hypothetical protein
MEYEQWSDSGERAAMKDAAKKNWVQVAWLLKLKATLEWGSFERHLGWNATRMCGENSTASVRRETATGNEVGIDIESCYHVNAAEAKFDR